MLYMQPPDDFSPSFELVKCYIEHDGHILFVKRHRTEGGHWGAVAGKIETQETIMDALLREIREETGLTFDPAAFTEPMTTYVRYPDRDFVQPFHIVLDERPALALKEDEHTEHRWVPRADILSLDLVLEEDASIKHSFRLA